MVDYYMHYDNFNDDKIPSKIAKCKTNINQWIYEKTPSIIYRL